MTSSLTVALACSLMYQITFCIGAYVDSQFCLEQITTEK